LKTEKEILTDFCILIISECGLSMSEDKSSWQKCPISGIRQAANDMLEMTRDLNHEQLKVLDAKLEALELPTVTKMRQKNYKKTLQILSREKVKNEAEWRILRSEVECGSYKLKELKKIQELMDTFEFQAS